MNYKNVNDYEVMYMIRENSEDAVNLMYKKYMPFIRKIAAKYFNSVKNCGVEFDDLVQEGMIALNNAILSYKENNDVLFYTYFTICLERHFITYCRNVNSSKSYYLNTSVRDDLFYSLAGKEEFSIPLIACEEFTEYKNNFDFLDANIFELRFNGFSYKEICKLLDLSYKVVESRLVKIKAVLREKEKTFI